MKRALPIIPALFFLLITHRAAAQYDYDDGGPLFSRPKALSLSVGSQGIGLDYTQNVKFGWSVRLGGSYLPFSYNYSGVFGNVNSDVKIKTKSFANAHLMVDWYPSEYLGLRITPGVGYFFNAKATAHVQPSGQYKYGDITLTGEDIGAMDGEMQWKGLAPYLGAGWLFFFNEGESPVSLGIDAGTYYLPRPEATLTGTKLLQNNSYNEQKFKENVKNYRWLPLLQVSIRYTFSSDY